MEQVHTRMSRLRVSVALVLVETALLAAGCRNYGVIASTATNIGVHIAQNPQTQVPEARLGYSRAELALVPTNLSESDKDGKRDGAQECADVLMELRYSGIFSWSDGSGIYQRLAVGKTAVQQTGAAFMFAKKPDGTIDETTAAALAKSLGKVPVADVKVEEQKAALLKTWKTLKAAAASDTKAKAQFDAFDEEVKKQGDYETFPDFVADPKGVVTGKKVEDIRSALAGRGVKFDK